MRRMRFSEEYVYDVIRAPVVTEKSSFGSEHNHVTFLVQLDASKPRIKMAVESLFNVRVSAVNTLIHKGKTKRFRGHRGKQSDIKKAIITLVEGDSIDVTTRI